MTEDLEKMSKNPSPLWTDDIAVLIGKQCNVLFTRSAIGLACKLTVPVFGSVMGHGVNARAAFQAACAGMAKELEDAGVCSVPVL